MYQRLTYDDDANGNETFAEENQPDDGHDEEKHGQQVSSVKGLKGKWVVFIGEFSLQFVEE